MGFNRVLAKCSLNLLNGGSSFYKVSLLNLNGIHTTSCKSLFWESDIKGGYNENKPKVSPIQMVKDGFKELKHELKLFKKEVKEKWECDPLLVYTPGIIDKQWSLKTEDDLETWTTTCDADHGEGFSSCNFSINQDGHGMFSGNLSSNMPKDGIIKRAGYCTIRTKRFRKSFKRATYHDWSAYTHLVIRLRGDGRSYMLNIATSGYFDQLWNDIYHYALFTRGGPYWQITKIPFSKFFFSNKGRIQDLQNQIPLNQITHFGITAADKVDGPFQLEIDYIGLEFVPYHNEEFAYEMYKLPKNLAAN